MSCLFFPPKLLDNFPASCPWLALNIIILLSGEFPTMEQPGRHTSSSTNDSTGQQSSVMLGRCLFCCCCGSYFCTCSYWVKVWSIKIHLTHLEATVVFVVLSLALLMLFLLLCLFEVNECSSGAPIVVVVDAIVVDLYVVLDQII